ncbi:baculoviral IAP repeat-containing protein 2-like [Mytilus californianus]|uniref:baculoviral IAP repeat-containing protein 2-like n=1 Tax=Mytilus californianus TaxID=6549 RepID=UPI002245449E|nr:baculoviral IAP repeat-containing protein 2-like [Mytilus californianus]XP_052096555.1 baculoviral IAP repeat-containing protein 2-like [Mytilus californianus]XP_052096556.1 baculoviral IAP repeat-containing protein 2-like [Mytilus californianus]
MSVQCSADGSKSKVYTFPTDNIVADVDSGSKVYCSGQFGGFAENRGVFHNESKNNISQNMQNEYIGSVVQTTIRQHQNGIISYQGFVAHTDEHANELIEKKQQLLFTRKQIGDGNEKRSNRAKFRSYSKLTIRKQSFIGWQSTCTLPIWMFAMAGFFYKGFADIVACFECGLVHRRWQKDDDPVKTHNLLQPDCPYIIDLIADGIQSCVDLHKFESNSCEQNIEMNDASDRNKYVAITSLSSSSLDTTTDERLQCKVCLTNPLQITIQPCGHFSLCESCYTHLKYENNRCPICRGPIKNTIRTYVP